VQKTGDRGRGSATEVGQKKGLGKRAQDSVGKGGRAGRKKLHHLLKNLDRVRAPGSSSRIGGATQRKVQTN